MEPEGMLPFEGGGSCPVQYEVRHNGLHFYLRYRRGWITIDVDDVEAFKQCLNPNDDSDGNWSDCETNVYLHVISHAIRQSRLKSFALPTKSEVAKHSLYKPGPLPRYSVCQCKLDHQHTSACYSEETYSAEELAKQNVT